MNAVAKKSFTVAEANQRLPLIKSIVQDIVELYKEVHDRRRRLIRIREFSDDSHKSSVYDDEVQAIEADLEKDIGRLEGFIDELHELGVELKDPVSGLIDFPARIDGRPVYLCWKLGEEEVGYWHELEAGFSGRRELMDGVLPGQTNEDQNAD